MRYNEDSDLLLVLPNNKDPKIELTKVFLVPNTWTEEILVMNLPPWDFHT